MSAAASNHTKEYCLLHIKVPSEVELYQDMRNSRNIKLEYFSEFKHFSFPLTSTIVTHKKQILRY
jgi:hypothetical protein